MVTSTTPPGVSTVKGAVPAFSVVEYGKDAEAIARLLSLGAIRVKDAHPN